MGKNDPTHKITHGDFAVAKLLQAVILCLVAGVGTAQPNPDQAERGVLNIMHTEDFELTGDGSASPWSSVEWIPVLQRRDSGRKYATDIKVLYSATGVYCLFRCEDRKITATLKEDFTDLYREDVIEVFFWPDESVPVYFEYELSPLDYELAIVVPNYNGRFFGWLPWHYDGDRVTRHATKVSDKEGDTSWTAEVFIPFALLKPLIAAPPEKGMRWRANFYRIDYDEGTSNWSWQLTQKTFHDYNHFGTIVFD
jgi:Carbohydrate family 9 binding domain-like